MAGIREEAYIQDMSAPGAPNYFKTHRPGPLSAAEIRRGIKATKAQIALVNKTLDELGLTKPRRATRTTAKRAPSGPRQPSKTAPRKSS